MADLIPWDEEETGISRSADQPPASLSVVFSRYWHNVTGLVVEPRVVFDDPAQAAHLVRTKRCLDESTPVDNEADYQDLVEDLVVVHAEDRWLLVLHYVLSQSRRLEGGVKFVEETEVPEVPVSSIGIDVGNLKLLKVGVVVHRVHEGIALHADEHLIESVGDGGQQGEVQVSKPAAGRRGKIKVDAASRRNDARDVQLDLLGPLNLEPFPVFGFGPAPLEENEVPFL